MNFSEVIAIANEGYGDDLIQQAWEGEDPGDTLATFVCRELMDVLPISGAEHDMLSLAISTLDRAVADLQLVIDAFAQRLEEDLGIEEDDDDLDYQEGDDLCDNCGASQVPVSQTCPECGKTLCTDCAAEYDGYCTECANSADEGEGWDE